MYILTKYSFCFSARSEEHTSELQSQSNLVCRLLLEKKKTKYGGNPDCTEGCGTAYKVERMPDGRWKEGMLHKFYTFPGDGVFPGLWALALDKANNAYGTTLSGEQRVMEPSSS